MLLTDEFQVTIVHHHRVMLCQLRNLRKRIETHSVYFLVDKAPSWNFSGLSKLYNNNVGAFEGQYSRRDPP